MRTRYFIFATLAMVLLAVSCQKAAVGGAQEPEEAPVPVQLTTNLKVNSVSVTKAAVDAWAGQDLYIYAIPTSGTDELQARNVKVSAPSSGNPGTVLTLAKEDGNYYYPANSSTYDFYGYYVDGAGGTSTPQDNQDNVFKLQITLDGSRDVMLAKADKEEDTAGKGIAPTHAYSAYSARKGVVPNLKFEHQLARFVFRVKAGNSPLSESVQINSVSLTSFTEAELYITGADRGIKNAGTPGVFPLKNLNGSAFTPCFPASSSSSDPINPIGESIMVIPADSHEMKITLQQKSNQTGETNLGEPFTITKTLVPEDVVDDDGGNCGYHNFLPGYQYNVNIVVYGRQEVKVNVTLSPWFEAGNIIIDDNEDWGDEPTMGLKAKMGDSDYYLYFYGELGADTEVKVWDPAQNIMVPAEEGTYEFDTQQGTEDNPIKFVKLEQEGEGESLKTVVTEVYADDPATQTTE